MRTRGAPVDVLDPEAQIVQSAEAARGAEAAPEAAVIAAPAEKRSELPAAVVEDGGAPAAKRGRSASVSFLPRAVRRVPGEHEQVKALTSLRG